MKVVAGILLLVEARMVIFGLIVTVPPIGIVVVLLLL
jgi:hypothetical protein